MSDDDTGMAHASFAAALEHPVTDVRAEGEGLDVDRYLLAAFGGLGTDPGEIGAALDLDGVEAVVDERLEEALRQDFLQQGAEAGHRARGDEAAAREARAARHVARGGCGGRGGL